MSEELEGWARYVETLDFQKFWGELIAIWPEEECKVNIQWAGSSEEEDAPKLWMVSIHARTEGWPIMYAEEGHFDDLEQLIALAKKWSKVFWYEFDSQTNLGYDVIPDKGGELKKVEQNRIVLAFNTTCRRFV